jgi:uncharacterized protein YhjY with autotransporter beta-barrel domain
MKLIFISRHAIRLASLALFLAAAANNAQAQTVSGSGSAVTITGSGSNFQYDGVNPIALTAGGTLTIGSSSSPSATTITNTSVYPIITLTEAAVVTNNGILTDTQADAFGISIDDNSTTASSITNSSGATISAVGTSLGAGTGIEIYNNLSGSATATNNGTLNASGGDSDAMYLSTSGTTTASNGGTLTSNNEGIVISQGGTLAYNVTVNNTGTITTGGNAIDVASNNNVAGSTLTINNSNNVTVSGTYTATGSFSGIYANNKKGVTQVNVTGGAIHVTAATGKGAYGIEAYNAGTGDTTIDITGGSVTATGSTSAYAVYDQSTAGNAFITNSQTITATTAAGTASGLYAYGDTGTGYGATVTNSGSVSATTNTGGSRTYGIEVLSADTGTITNSGTGTVSAYNKGSASAYGMYISGPGNLSVTNTSTGLVSGTTAPGGGATGSAIYVKSTSGSAYIKSSGPTSSTGPSAGDAITLEAQGSTTSTINNSGMLSATTAPGSGYTSDIFVDGESPSVATTMTVINSGTGMSTGSSSYGISVYGTTGGGISITNSGNLTAQGTETASGIYAEAHAATVMITNSATVSGSGSGSSSGIYATDNSTAGAMTITNTKTGSATGSTTATSGGIGGIGIFASSTGNVTINNAGYASGTSAGAGTGSGIYATANGTTTINNTGTATGSTYGIYSENVTTVNDGGTVSGTTNSIYVGSGSTVHLTGSSPLSGIIRGGSDDTSTSLLDFSLTVRSGYAQAKADLDAAIAAYDAAYSSAAKGPGNDVTSSVVVINGSDYQWEDFLTIEDNLIQGRLYADTPNFRSEGTVLDNLNGLNPQAAKILNALGNLPDSALPAALSELSPKELELFRNVAFDNNTFNDQQIDNHLANLRDGLTGFDSSALTIHDSGMDSALAPISSHLLAYNPASTPGLLSDATDPILGGVDGKEMKDTKAVMTMPTERWSSFIAGDVILADLSGNPNLDNSNYTTGSVTGGVDYRLSEKFTLGALFAYAHTDADLDARGSRATVDSYSPGIYASYVDGPWYGNALGSYTRNSYTSDRQINIAGISGDNHGATSGNQGSVNLTGGYEFRHGAFKFGPVASVDYVHLAIDSTQEEGPTALSIGSQDQDSFRSRLGAEARYEAMIGTPFGPVLLKPHVSASWQREYLDNSDGINSQFTGTGGGSFITKTDTPNRDSGFFDGGLDATLCKNITLYVDYEAQAGQDNFFAQSAQGGVKIGF